ncbi:MAG: valine--tRNA ligase, partial [Clostridia bacterium]|nr:valine--tRNA ligase [Clostridia bacterium]
MAKELATKYDPSEFEDKIYDFWQENKYFHAEPDETKTPYTIVIPPPNITGQLHMGHALDNTLQDILIRYHRMKGFDTLWVPGTDHASIATEAKIVEAMKQEGITKDDIGREAFLERAWDWRRQYGGRIVEQLKKLGSSCDWDRERFTMDEGCSKAVVEVFNRLYEKGLIYRGERLINWCPHCMTSISDAEVEYEEKDGAFWHLRYPFADGSGYLELATTRPETMFGDTAVAVNPEDPRYKDKIGQMLILPLVGKEIPLIGDEHADPEFGTGVVKITPAHDPNDYEVGLRHDLPIINVMTDDGRMNENVPEKYVGMTTEECRKACVADLEEQGYLVRVEPMKHNVGTCYRCGTVVEPRISKQWFVKMKPLADPAIDIVRSGKVQFVPSRYDKTYFHWMENIKDWCISRQLWWGHRIPAWYCDDCGEITVSRGTPCKCEHCGSEHIHQDEDTLDTWFSSALWPFSTLGWPDETPELKHYFPTNTLVTGYDIIFFWVARMIFSSVEQMGTYPFDTIFIHGIVRDELGRKMSKSLGNGIDPLVVIDKYGADALRFTLVTGNSPGNDMRYSEKKVEASRNFGNKIWNAARYILMNLDGSEGPAKLPAAEDLAIEDKWILSKFNTLCKEVSENIDSYELGVALAKLYDFIWDLFCDWYIEISKIRLQEGGKGAETAKAVLIYCMDGMLKLLHPFMPFLTEEIWQSLPHEGDTIMLAPYPEYTDALDFSAEETEFERIMTAVRAIRARRSEMNVPPSKKSAVHFDTPFEETFRSGVVYIQRLASATEVTVGGDFDTEGAVNIVTADAQIYLPMNELVDLDAERERLTKELEKAQKDLAFFEKKLNNPGFVNNAPAAVVEKDRASAEKIKDKINLLEE